MKRDQKSQRPKSDHKAAHNCPFFKKYYTGICGGHKLPYAPSNEEKRQYCLSEDFRMCLIYGESTSTSEEK